MKRANKSSVLIAILVVAALVLVTAARAQILGSPIGVTNTGTVGQTSTNGPVSSFGVVQTNQIGAGLNPRFLQVGNISTNETLTAQYGWIISSQGASNFWISSTLVTNFPMSNGWTQGATFSTTIPNQSAIVSVTPFGILTVSNASNTVLWQ